MKQVLLFVLIMGGTEAGAEPRDRVSYRLRGEPQTLDWNRAKSYIEGSLLLNLMEGLVRLNEKQEVVPQLAERWEVTPDGKQYTFYLRKKVLWSDGVPLHAQHFIDGWKRLLSPLTGAAYAYFLFDLVGAEDIAQGKSPEGLGARAIDPWTLEVQLKAPRSHFLQLLAFWATFPIRKDLIENPQQPWLFPGLLVTLGPYLWKAHSKGETYFLQANPTYWGERGSIQTLEAHVIADDSRAIQWYEQGQLDFLHDLSGIQATVFQSRPDWRVFPRLKTLFLAFETQQKPTHQVTFRKAIAHALEKEPLCRALSEFHQPASSFVPPGIPGFFEASKLGIPYDPKKARELLRSTLPTSSSPLPKLTYLLPNWEKSKLLGKAVQAQLQSVLGLEVSLKFLENQAYRAQLDLHLAPLYDFSWTADYPHASNFLGIYLSASGNGGKTWQSPAFDTRFLKALELPPNDQPAAFLSLQKTLLEEEILQVPLCYEPNLALIRPGLEGFEMNALDFLWFGKAHWKTVARKP